MWARTVEFTLAIWLGISWIIFQYSGVEYNLLWNDFLCFAAISFFSLLSYSEKMRHLHLLNFAVGLWLIVLSYFLRHIGWEFAAQNYMTLSLLLMMLSIIPTHSRRPPYQWIKFKNKDL